MARAPLQVLILPYRRLSPEYNERFEYAVFSRADYQCWQFIAGGAEDEESALEAAKREAFEEGGIDPKCAFYPLDSTTSIPVYYFRESRNWSESLYVVQEHSFGVDMSGLELHLSAEHSEHRWLSYMDALACLTYDSNKTALWELNRKLLGKGPRD